MEEKWGGEERRQEDRKTVYEQLGELRVRMTHIEDAVADFKEMKEDVHTIKELLTQGEGAVKVLKLLFIIIGPIVLAGYWIKDHLR
jgi:hypothetical protein